MLGSALGLPVAVSSLLADLKGNLKITGIETDLLHFPPRKPTYDAIRTFGVEGGGVVLRILTNAGVTGWAYSSFGAVNGGPETVRTILEQEIKPQLLDRDPSFPRKIRADLWKHLEYHGVGGITQFALAAVDIALWDILGKSAGMPVYKMLGAHHDKMPVYAMCGWYQDNDPDLSQYKAAIERHLEEGFLAVKIKTGRSTLDDDIRRIQMAMDLCGKSRRVMVDANQALNKNEALRRGRVYQQMGCFWYEEPMPPHERDGYAMLAHELDIRIATGENEYTKFAFLELLKRNAVDVVQPDNRRAGGVLEWMEISALAEAFGVEVASHGGGPTNLHMLLAMPNAIYMETGSIKGDSSTVEPLRLKDGAVLAPQTAGMGSELKADYIRKFKVG